MSKYPNWTEEELTILKENYSTLSSKELHQLLPLRNPASINTKASHLGLAKRKWGQQDIEMLTKMVLSEKSVADIWQAFGGKFSRSAIKTKAFRLHLNFRPLWTEKEEYILKTFYPIYPIDQFQCFLNRSREAIISHAKTMGLSSYLTWTFDEEQYLTNHWKDMSDKELSYVLHKSQLCVKTKRHALGYFRRDRTQKNYSELSKFIRSNNTQWKKDSMEKDHYRCVVTGSKDFEVHHLVNVSTLIHETLKNLNLPFKDFKNYSDDELNQILNEYLRLQGQYPLGICLRKDLHVLFHSLYGQQNNTPEQFNRFLRSIQEENLVY